MGKEEKKGKLRFFDPEKRCHIFSDELLQVSCTDLSLAKNCEMALYHKLTQPKSVRSNPYLFMGSIFHSVMAANFKQKLESKKDFTYKEMKYTLIRHFEAQKDKVEWNGKVSPEKAKQRLEAWLARYLKERCQFIKPRDAHSIEFYGYFQIHDSDFNRIRITYKIDILDASLYILDHKTCGDMSKWTQEKAEAEMQAHVYPVALQAKGIPVRGLQFSCVSEKECKVFNVEPNKEKAQEIFRACFALQRSFRESNLLVNHRHCNFCEWKACCSEAK